MKLADCRYPRQVAVARRRTVTLSIEAALEIAGEAKNSRGEIEQLPPMSMHSPYSRFVITLIDTSKVQKIYPWANIPPSDVGVLKTLTDTMLKESLLAQKVREKDGDTEEGSAYTTKILVSKLFRGRTPASVLLEDSDNLDKLLQTAEFLETHLDESKFRAGNLKQIEAIREAVELYRSGELSEQEVQGRDPIVVYHVPSKTLRNRKPKGDKYFTYSIKIDCLVGYTYPWTIWIENSYVRIKDHGDGTFESVPSTAIDKSASKIQLTDYEFGGIVNSMYMALCNFETVFFRQQYGKAMQLHDKKMRGLGSEKDEDFERAS